MSEKLYVGQELLIRNDFANTFSNHKITKVGRKYFEIENGIDKFSIETMRRSGRRYVKFTAFRNQEEYDAESKRKEEEKERTMLINKIKMFFRQFGIIPITLQQVRDIDKIINEGGKQ